MAGSARGPVVVAALLGAALAVVGAVVGYKLHAHRAPAQVAVQMPTTAPSTQPARIRAQPPTPATKPQAIDSYMDVVRAEYPSLPTTQPLSMPLDVTQAGRLVLKDPIYLSRPPRADLWITRPDAPPTAEVLRAAINPKEDVQTHVTRENVIYVHWMPVESGLWPPYLICQTRDGKLEVVTANGRRPLPVHHDYRWDRAWSWNDKIVVPTRTGLGMLQLEPQITESYHELISPEAVAKSEPAEPQVVEEWQGFIAWGPWEGQKIGSRGAARFADGKWSDLGPDEGWDEKIVHLILYQDGSVLQLARKETGLQLALTSLERVQVNEQKIKELVEQLDDADEQVRKKAFEELTTFGAGAAPILEKLVGDEGPQAQALIRQLLKNQVTPNLGGTSLLGDKSLRLISRLSDGGVVLYAENGASVTDAEGNQTPVAPAWIACRPGHVAQLLPQVMVNDLKPDKVRFDVANDQWVMTADVRGPRLFYGNGFATLLHKDERAYSQLIGTDRVGRWLFRKPGAPSETLVLDPRLPDPTPRLPAWEVATAEAVGWDKVNWPAVKHGGWYALTEDGWTALDDKQKVFTEPPAEPPATAPATATAPTSQPTESEPPVASRVEPPLLVDPDGTKYYGGTTELRVIKPNGRRITWPLPALIQGTGPVRLLHTADDRLFLFNQPGRIARLKPTPGKTQPFEHERTFVRNIPTADHLTRIWLDPAGRIDIAYNNRLVVLFPAGFIPPRISEMMLNEGDEVAGP